MKLYNREYANAMSICVKLKAHRVHTNLPLDVERYRNEIYFAEFADVAIREGVLLRLEGNESRCYSVETTQLLKYIAEDNKFQFLSERKKEQIIELQAN